MEFITQLFSQKALLFDLLLAVILLIFAILGARRGMVLSLCSLVAVILALVGGTLVADTLTPPMAAQAAPMVEDFLQEHLEQLLLSGSEALKNAEGFFPNVIRTVLIREEWPIQASLFTPEFTLAVTAAILRPIIFLLAFVVILILWYFISHALDLVARLPVLSFLNALGGFLIGAVKGLLFLMVVYLLLQFFRPDLIPGDILSHSRILGLFQKVPAFF